MRGKRLGGDGALPACVVDGVVGAVFPVQNQLADGDDLIAFSQQIFQDVGQGLRGMEGGVVEEHNGPGPTLEVTRWVIVAAS